MILEIKEPIFVISKKDYATGERTFEAICVDNSKINLQRIVTFRDSEDLASKDFLKLGKDYKLLIKDKED